MDVAERIEESKQSEDDPLMECIFIAFLSAIHAGDVEMAQQLCRPGFIDRTDNYGMKPIHWVTELGHSDVLVWLIGSDVDINAETEDGKRRRPIHLAAMFGHELALVYLIAAQCDVAATDEDNMSALDYASAGMNPFYVAWLMDVQASTDQQNDGHATEAVADERKFHAFMQALCDRDMHKAQQMFSQDHLYMRFGECKRNPLQEAAERGQQDMVQWLIKQGASLDTTEMNGHTAAHLAAIIGHADVLQLLIDAGCETDIVDNDGWTAMDYARFHGQEECVRVLAGSQVFCNVAAQNDDDSRLGNFEIDMKAIPAVCDSDNENPLVNKAKIVARSLLTKEGMVAFCALASNEALEMPMLTDMMRNMTHDEWMALMDALKAKWLGDSTELVATFLFAFCGHDDVLQLAMKREYHSIADSEAGTGLNGMTPLMYAVMCGNVNAVRMLAGTGVNVEGSAEDKERLVHLAAKVGHEEILQCLIDEGGCVIDAVNKDGDTPLDIANEYGHERCAALLRNAMETRSKTEFTVVHLPSYSVVFRNHQIFDMDNADRHIQERVIPLNRPVVICHSTALCGYLLSSTGTLQLISDGLAYEEYVAIGAETNRHSVESSVTQLRDWNVRFMWDDKISDGTIPQSDVAVEIDKATAGENWRDHLLVSIDLRAEGTDVTKETVTMLMMATAAANEMKDVFVNFVRRRLRANLMMTADGRNSKDTLARMILMNNRLMTFYDSRWLKIPSSQKLNETVVVTDGCVSVLQKCFDDVNFLGASCTNDNMSDMVCEDYVLIRSVTEERIAIAMLRRECFKASDIASKIESFLDIKGKLLLLSTEAVIDLNIAIDDVDDVIHYAVISP